MDDIFNDADSGRKQPGVPPGEGSRLAAGDRYLRRLFRSTRLSQFARDEKARVVVSGAGSSPCVLFFQVGTIGGDVAKRWGTFFGKEARATGHGHGLK